MCGNLSSSSTRRACRFVGSSSTSTWCSFAPCHRTSHRTHHAPRTSPAHKAHIHATRTQAAGMSAYRHCWRMELASSCVARSPPRPHKHDVKHQTKRWATCCLARSAHAATPQRRVQHASTRHTLKPPLMSVRPQQQCVHGCSVSCRQGLITPLISDINWAVFLGVRAGTTERGAPQHTARSAEVGERWRMRSQNPRPLRRSR